MNNSTVLSTSVTDPDPVGSTSGNVDPDPSSKKIVMKLSKKINQNYKNIYFLFISLILFNILE